MSTTIPSRDISVEKRQWHRAQVQDMAYNRAVRVGIRESEVKSRKRSLGDYLVLGGYVCEPKGRTIA